MKLKIKNLIILLQACAILFLIVWLNKDSYQSTNNQQVDDASVENIQVDGSVTYSPYLQLPRSYFDPDSIVMASYGETEYGQMGDFTTEVEVITPPTTEITISYDNTVKPLPPPYKL